MLALVPEESRPEAQNRTHLDLRLEPVDDADVVAAEIAEPGGRELDFGRGDLPWRHFTFTVLCPVPPDVRHTRAS